MPIYTYKCFDCGNVFDIAATIQEKEESKSKKFLCSKCRSKNIKQEFSVVNFIKNIFKSDSKNEKSCSCKNKNNKCGCSK